MAYNTFAYYYDALNEQADYGLLAAELIKRLKKQGIKRGIIIDLGCGTGEVSLRLAKAGYDMIGVDSSEDMLSIFREKLADAEQGGDILLLHQPLEELDLYGTVNAAVSTFDTLNHLTPEQAKEAIRRTTLFLEPGGVFLFDVNTPYKHKTVLADKQIEIEGKEGDLLCRWQNHYHQKVNATEICIEIWEEDTRLCSETFFEYVYPLEFWEEQLTTNNLKLVEIVDGETFSTLSEQTERYFIMAKKELS